MRQALDLQNFTAAPEGTWCGGMGWLAFSTPRHEINGLIFCGEVTEEEAPKVLQLFDFGRRITSPAARYFDIRELDAPRARVLEPLLRHWVAHSSELAVAVHKVAVVHDGALSEVLARGVPAMVSGALPIRRFRKPAAAWRWLRPDVPLTLLHEVDLLRVSHFGRTVFVAKDGSWFRRGAATHHVASTSLRRILVGLVRARAEDRGGLSVREVFELGWPDDTIRPASAAQRVYVAISALRGSALGRAIVRGPDGYAIDLDARFASTR